MFGKCFLVRNKQYKKEVCVRKWQEELSFLKAIEGKEKLKEQSLNGLEHLKQTRKQSMCLFLIKYVQDRFVFWHKNHIVSYNRFQGNLISDLFRLKSAESPYHVASVKISIFYLPRFPLELPQSYMCLSNMSIQL